jgi:hypothetical protein
MYFHYPPQCGLSTGQSADLESFAIPFSLSLEYRVERGKGLQRLITSDYNELHGGGIGEDLTNDKGGRRSTRSGTLNPSCRPSTP